jgi:hypothetical protein
MDAGLLSIALMETVPCPGDEREESARYRVRLWLDGGVSYPVRGKSLGEAEAARDNLLHEYADSLMAVVVRVEAEEGDWFDA